MEAKVQVESGAVDCGESDDEQPREVSSLHLSLSLFQYTHIFSLFCRERDMCQIPQMVRCRTVCVCVRVFNFGSAPFVYYLMPAGVRGCQCSSFIIQHYPLCVLQCPPLAPLPN